MWGCREELNCDTVVTSTPWVCSSIRESPSCFSRWRQNFHL